MEKALEELKLVVDYQTKNLELDQEKKKGSDKHGEGGQDKHSEGGQDKHGEGGQGIRSRLSKSRRILGIGMTARRNLCIHPEIAQEADRDKIDEKCTKLTAPWIRRKGVMNSLRGSRVPSSSSAPSPSVNPPSPRASPSSSSFSQRLARVDSLPSLWPGFFSL